MILQAHNITHYYGQDIALQDVNLTVKQGEFVAIVGESGSGKSTLLSILSTLLQPTEGTLQLFGKQSHSIKDIDSFRRDNIGFIFQFHYLINYLNAYENITLAIYEKYKKEVHPLLQSLGIEHLTQKYPNEISGGERQRVAIARALANKPKIIFADEPTGNLDSKNSHNVFALLKKIVRESGTTVITVTHDKKLAHYADTIYEMTDGHISKNN